jgi:hypothetical protein
MKTSDFRNKPTSSQLIENMNKMFGVNVNFNKYSREQLEDMRNKLRTRVFQQEGKAGINDLLTNETYQKDKAMLALLNTRIKEMLGEDIKKLRDKMTELSEAKKGVKAPKYKIHAQGTAAKDSDDGKKTPAKKAVADKKVKEDPNEGNAFGKAVRDAKADGVQKGEKVKVGGKSYPVKEAAKPDFLDMDKDGNKKEPMKKAVKDKKVKEGFPTVDDAKKAAAGTASMKSGDKKKSSTGGTIEKTATGLKHTAGKNYGGQDAPKAPDSDKKAKKTMKESQFNHNVKFVNESLQFLLAEDEEGKAKAITAAGDMVNDYTSWMQRVGQYQTKTMIELADAIKADFGAAEAEAFKQAVGPALSATLEVLTQQREAVSNAVAVLAGEATPDMGMGMEPGMDAGMAPEPSMDIAAPDDMNAPAGDEFGASDAAAGMGTTGREMRESKFARKLAESHSILSKLAK